jgi:hypothetical protein
MTDIVGKRSQAAVGFVAHLIVWLSRPASGSMSVVGDP